VDDRSMVRELLGREPLAEFDVVVRDEHGWPVVIRNAPVLADGRPMPTRYWLVGRTLHRAVSRLEAAGGVRRAQAEVDPEAVKAAHERHAHERHAHERHAHERGDGASVRSTASAVMAGGVAGGVAGTRTGVKCLHAHYAWYLAGGPDPVGAWVQARLDERAAIPDSGLRTETG
jgi:uncharacterized protein